MRLDEFKKELKKAWLKKFIINPKIKIRYNDKTYDLKEIDLETIGGDVLLISGKESK